MSCDDDEVLSCTEEAKICSDGSSVSRDPDNNCEFAPCPGDDDTTILCCAEPMPSDFECGLSGCNCCSDGKWVRGNSGPTYPPGTVCNRLNLEPSEPCAVVDTCTTDVKECDDGSYVSRDATNDCKFFPCPVEGQCGPNVVCEAGTQCCNASCGICVEPDMACIQIACDPPV